MNQQPVPNVTLFDLLARNWHRPAPIRQICFNDDETLLAVVCADGSVAFARMADNEPPGSSHRDRQGPGDDQAAAGQSRAADHDTRKGRGVRQRPL